MLFDQGSMSLGAGPHELNLNLTRYGTDKDNNSALLVLVSNETEWILTTGYWKPSGSGFAKSGLILELNDEITHYFSLETKALGLSGTWVEVDKFGKKI